VRWCKGTREVEGQDLFYYISASWRFFCVCLCRFHYVPFLQRGGKGRFILSYSSSMLDISSLSDVIVKNVLIFHSYLVGELLDIVLLLPTFSSKVRALRIVYALCTG